MKMEILYKYRGFNTYALSMLIDRELYFADPKHLNDPYDCQISIAKSVKAAITIAESEKASFRSEIEKLSNLNESFNITEKNAKGSGIFSLSKDNCNMLMWSHYAEAHSGFCIGFNLSEKFKTYKEQYEEDQIIGLSECHYTKENPFIKYTREFTNSTEKPDWTTFWTTLIKYALLSKTEPWSHEKEMRIIRKTPGFVKFLPQEINQIIFGHRMLEENRKTIRNLLSSNVWNHIKYRQVIKKEDSFDMEIQDI